MGKMGATRAKKYILNQRLQDFPFFGYLLLHSFLLFGAIWRPILCPKVIIIPFIELAIPKAVFNTAPKK